MKELATIPGIKLFNLHHRNVKGLVMLLIYLQIVNLKAVAEQIDAVEARESVE